MDETEAMTSPGLESGSEPQEVPVNMYEATDAVVVVAPMPGVQAEDVEVCVEGRVLELSARMRSAAPKEYLLHEWHYGPFHRRVELPDGFEGEAAATFGNGQLAVRVSRGQAATGRRVVQPNLAGT